MRLYLLLLCFPLWCLAQSEEPRQSDFTTTTTANGAVQFTPIDPPLSQIAGGKAAFYTYFWEFGDGDFSREGKPLHHYKTPGNYSALLHCTAHYDDGDNPRGKQKGIIAQGGGPGIVGFASLFKEQDTHSASVRIISNQQAKHKEDLLLVLGYKNNGRNTTSGRLLLFFNEKNYPNDHFYFKENRHHHNERHQSNQLGAIPSFDLGGYYGHAGEAAWIYSSPPPDFGEILEKQREKYRNEELWRFTDLAAGEERHIFVDLGTSPGMLRDTSAIIHMTGLYLPDDPNQEIDEYVFEIEIVNGHDPNAISVSDVRINYRFIQHKKLDYKVRFQNDGDGVADSITILIEQPKNLFKTRIEPKSWYPDCPPCNRSEKGKSCMETLQKGDSLLFIFHNIYLPGSKQKDITDPDSTKGYVVYRIKPERDMPKYDFKSRAHIYFDKEEAVLTNYTHTHFKKGISPGPKAGYGMTFDEDGSGYFFVGASFAPFKSWKAYPQIELLTGLKGQGAFATMSGPDTTIFPTPNGIDTVLITSGSSEGKKGFVSLDLPISIRKSISKWFALGLGVNTQFRFVNGTETTLTRTDYYIREQFPNAPWVDINQFTEDSSTNDLKGQEIRVSPFLDLTLGRVRQGPNVGLRAGMPIGEKGAKPWIQLALEVKL